MSRAAVTVDGVSKRFRLYRERNQSLKAALMRGKRASFEEFWALRDVSFEIPEGSTFGLIGENGSGKSTMLKCVAQILRPDTGKVTVDGRIAALLELGSGFHPELSGRENVYLNGSILGLSKRELEQKFDEIVSFAGIEEFIDQPVKNYSSGMYVRLGFAIAINVDPDILLVDEVLAVGDAAFQEKCMDKFADFRRQGKTVVIVSHALGSLRSMCDHAIWLEHGRLIKAGRANEIVDGYMDATHVAKVQKAEATPTGPVEIDSSVQLNRHGSGEVQVTSVEILNGQQQHQERFRTGDTVLFRLHYRCLQPIDNAAFGYSLENQNGVYVWAHNSIDAELRIAGMSGTGSIDLVIPALPLQPGTYDLSASVVDHHSHVFDAVRGVGRFHVDFGSPRESGGITTLGSHWANLLGDGLVGVEGNDSSARVISSI